MLGSNPLFRDGVESLICREMEAEILGRETSFERASGQLESLSPDVIIVDASDPGCDPMEVVAVVFQMGLEAKVISININDNQLHIYRGEHKVAKETKDLVEAIQS
jgi:DNA-binding NarL/FixJ family response regulator